MNWSPREERNGTKLVPWIQQKASIERYHQRIKPWRIHVWDQALPVKDQALLRLYLEIEPGQTRALVHFHGGNRSEPADPYRYLVRGGPLDETICQTKADAHKVAREACRLLNKLRNLNPSDFPETVSLLYVDWDVRKTIELLSLNELGPQFNYRRIRPVLWNTERRSPGQYTLSHRPTVRKHHRGLNYLVQLPIFLPGLQTIETRVIIRLADTSFDQASLDKLPTAPPWWGVKTMRTEMEATNKMHVSMDSMIQYINYLYWKLFGYCGSVEAVNYLVRHIGSGKPIKDFMSQGGLFGGRPLFAIQFTSVAVSPAVAKTISGSVPVVYHRLPFAQLAIAMQSAYQVWKQKAKILSAIDELFVCVEEFRMGTSKRNATIQCQCESDDKRLREAHYLHVLSPPLTLLRPRVDHR